MMNDPLKTGATDLLRHLIATPSLSGAEQETANLIAGFLGSRGVPVMREGNNVWARNKFFGPDLPTILLNSHHDTVKPAEGYTLDPYEPKIEDGKLFGLGSNDAGGALVSLLATFLYFYEKPLRNFNLTFAATAEEEISGENGISAILPRLGKIDLGVVGEPTRMQMAVAEKGLMVLDCRARGKSGHAARDEGDNAIYKALKDIEWIKGFQFPRATSLLGPVKMTVTQVKSGYQHNVVPDTCEFVVDIRVNEQYTNREILEFVKKNLVSDVKARSLRLNSSAISPGHPIVKRGEKLGLSCYGSPTLSDQALMNFTTIKIGPGDSARSHTADEFIYVAEIENGIDMYIALLEGLTL